MGFNYVDKENISQVIDKYSNMVFKLALNQTGNKSDAEDVFQEVFIRLVEKQPRFENEEHLKAWLIRVTINCSKKIFSSFWHKKRTELSNEMIFEDKEDEFLYYEVLELPRKYKIVIHLYYYEDYSVNKIAEILKIKQSTVKTHLFRARNLLKNKLKGGVDYEWK